MIILLNIMEMIFANAKTVKYLTEFYFLAMFKMFGAVFATVLFLNVAVSYSMREY